MEDAGDPGDPGEKEGTPPLCPAAVASLVPPSEPQPLAGLATDMANLRLQVLTLQKDAGLKQTEHAEYRIATEGRIAVLTGQVEEL